MENHKLKHLKKLIEGEIVDPLVNFVMLDRVPNPYETDEHYRKRIKKRLTQSYFQFIDSLDKALEILKNHGQWPHETHFQELRQRLSSLEALEEQIQQGKLFQEILGIKEDEMTVFYQTALDLYHAHRDQEAQSLFIFLTQLNPFVATFWSFLGMLEERNHHLEQANLAYLFAAELEETTLAPYLHAEKCLLMLHREEESLKVLHRALERSNENPKLHGWQPKVDEMLKCLSH